MQQKTNWQTPNWLRVLCLTLLVTMAGLGVKAQVTLATTLANNNGSGVVVGNLYNSNSYPILINTVHCAISVAGTQTFQLWTKAVSGPNMGAPGPVDALNGWTLQASQSVTAAAATSTALTGTACPVVLSGLNVSLDPSTYYLVCIGATNINYSTIGTQTCTFSGGGVDLTYCASNGYGGTFGSPANTPRGLVGAIVFTPALACSGTPTPGNTLASATSACPGVPVNFSIQNFPGTGATYQWYNNAGAIAGATNGTYSATVTVSDSYYCDVTCSGSTASSTPVSVTPNSFFNCYCASSATSTADEDISNVTFGTLNNSSICTTLAPGPGSAVSLYSNYKSGTGAPTPPMVMQGALVPFSLTQTTCNGNYGNSFDVYIDYNQNGVFTDAGELAFDGPILTGNHTDVGIITIPIGALVGTTAMRVVNVEGGATSPCGTYNWGETEDYLIEITATTACSGTPNPGNTIASAASVCPSTVVNFSLQNNTPGTGVTYQWYNNSGAIAGATNGFYSQAMVAADDIYCDVTCGASTTSSNLVSVALNGFMDCYCGSAATIAADEELYNVTLNGASTDPAYSNANGCTTAAPGPGSILSRYSNFKTIGSLTSLMVGAPAPFEVRQNECDGASYYNNGIGIWIDYNQNGLFTDPGEAVYIEATTSAATGLSPAGDKVISGTIIPPFTATLGQTVMRVIAAESYAGASLNPCLSYGYGETEDYVITLTPNTLCSGTPTPGNTIASTTLACLGQTVNFSLQNLTSGGGVTYQWYSAAGGAIAGATNMTYSIASFTATDATDYWCDVTCTASSSTTSSTSITVAQNSYINCYCPATASFGSFAGDITNVSLNSLANTTVFPASPYYTNFGSTPSTTLNVGDTYPLAVTVGQYSQAAVWFDWDHNGIFDASEYTFLGTISGATATTFTQLITVPVTAVTGTTKMRIRGEYYGYTLGAAQACGNLNYGETEDYDLTVVIPTPCSGAPAPGNTLASASSVCAGATVNFSLSNTNMGTGITYQWYNNSGAIAGATSAFYSQVITAADDIYCDVTCTNSSTTTSSNLVSVALNSFISCYCGSVATQTADEELYQVTVNGGSTDPLYANANGCTTPAPGPGSILSRYSNFTTLPAITTVIQAQTVSFEVRQNECDGGSLYANGIGMWIDYNHNGVFTDAGEAVYIEATTSAATGASPTGDKVRTGTFTVPLGALTGPTGMRVITAEGYAGTSLNPCLAYGYGETEDYVINIDPAAVCTGAPTPGNTLASSNPVCPGANVTLSLQNPPVTLGVTYQWYNGAGAIAGATDATHTVTGFTTADSYYCDVTCTGSSSTTASTPIALTVSGFINCYCVPPTTFYNCTYDWIGNVTFGAINNTSGCTAPHIAYPSTITTSVTAGIATPISLSTVGYSGYFDVFVDLNQDGIFQVPSERLLTDFLVGPTGSSSGSYTGATNITIPTTATAGQTKMRVRYDYFYTAYNGLGAQDPCAQLYEGETEDYFIDIVLPVLCSGTPAPGATMASATAVCAGTTVNFSIAPVVAAGITYQWFNGAGAIAGATNASYSAVITAADSYYCDVTCSAGPSTGSSTPVAITLNSPTTCYCVAGATTDGASTSNEYVGNVTFNTINNSSSSTTGTTPPGYVDYTSISTNVTQGSSYTASVTIPNWFGGDQAAVWIDYNQDGLLDDATERTLLTTGGGSGITPLTGTVTIPGSALTGATRMRVRGNFTGTMSSCGITTYGEVEDYTVVIDPLITSSVLNLSMFIQGYYDATTGAMLPALMNQGMPNAATDCDSITVELRDATTYAVVQSVTPVLQTNGTAVCTFPAMSGSYYIAVKHRSALQTWSANPVTMGATPTSYDFTTAATQAYGDNQIEVAPGVFAFYSGDIVIDENMDLLDLGMVEADISIFNFGYVPTDINGDGNVDLLDSPPVETNISNFIFSIHP